MGNIVLKKFKHVLVMLIICTLVLFYSSNKSYASDDGFIGGGFYGGYPHDNLGGVFNFKFDDFPIVFGVAVSDLNLDDYFLRVDVLIDYWVLDSRILGPLYGYLGPGFAFSFDIKDNRQNFDFEIDFRLPIGIALVFGPFEIYGEVAPGVKFLEVLDNESVTFFGGDDLFVLSGQVGLRLWL